LNLNIPSNDNDIALLQRNRTVDEGVNSLSEKDQRRYAAVEAQKLGRSGITYASKLLGCSRSTIDAGLKEAGALLEKT
jgi:hypothetical protein